MPSIGLASFTPVPGRPCTGTGAHQWHLNTPITGWNEALIAYVLAAGPESSPIDPEAYHIGWANEGWHRNGNSYYGYALPAGMPYGGPLFLSQYSFCTLDPRNLRDAYVDHWQQVVAHARINFEHCKRNPKGHGGYGVHGWGLTASDGPRGYLVSCPENDHGVLSPTAALSSLLSPSESGSGASVVSFVRGRPALVQIWLCRCVCAGRELDFGLASCHQPRPYCRDDRKLQIRAALALVHGRSRCAARLASPRFSKCARLILADRDLSRMDISSSRH